MTDNIRTWKPEPQKSTETPTPKKRKPKPMADRLWDTCIEKRTPIRLPFTDGETLDAVLVACDTYHFKLRTNDKRVRVAFKHAVKTIELEE